MIPQRLLKLRLVRQNFPIPKVPNFEDEIGLNSCLQSGVATGISRAIFRIEAPRTEDSASLYLSTADNRLNSLRDP